MQTDRLRSVNRQLVKEIQQRKGAEQTLQQTNHRLREAISQLEHAQDHAIRRERLHALEEIAGGIAHDVNNSLSKFIRRQAKEPSSNCCFHCPVRQSR